MPETSPSGPSAPPAALPGKGTPDDPILDCKNNLCNIDFGEFVLTGIPENFDEYVEASGTSGGTEAILSLIEQMSKQLEEKGDTTGAAEFKKLANLGHIIADGQAIAESKAQSCKNALIPVDCFRDGIHMPSEMELSSTKLEALPEFDPGTATVDLIRQSKFFEVKNQLDNNPDVIEDIKNSYPAFQMMEIYESIMASSKYSAATKDLTQQLLLNIDDLIYTQNGLIESSMAGGLVPDYPKVNFVTGLPEVGKTFDVTTDISQVSNPSYSSGTNFNSALICSTGHFDDKGKECQK